MKTTSQKYKVRGFTLLELLVSMTVTVIILGVMFLVTRTGFASLDTNRTEISAYTKAELALNQLTEDLESLVIQSGNNFEWLVADTVQSTAQTDNAFVSYFSDLAFFTVALDRYDGDYLTNENLVGDVSAVRYGISFVNQVNLGQTTNRKMVLYRQIVDPSDSFRSAANPTGFLGSGDLLTSFDSFNGPALQDPNNLITDNIRELTVNLTVEYTDDMGNIEIVRVPIIDINSPNTSDSVRLNGNGIAVESDALSAGEIEFIRNGKVQSIDINAQILAEDSDGLLNQTAALPEEAIERDITRFSRTVFIPQAQ